MPCNDHQGSTFISFGSSSMIKSLLCDIDSISTCGSNFAFFAHWTFTSFHSHMLHILSCKSHTSPALNATWNHEFYFLNPSEIPCFCQPLSPPLVNIGNAIHDLVWDHIFAMHHNTCGGIILHCRVVMRVCAEGWDHEGLEPGRDGGWEADPLWSDCAGRGTNRAIPGTYREPLSTREERERERERESMCATRLDAPLLCTGDRKKKTRQQQ